MPRTIFRGMLVEVPDSITAGEYLKSMGKDPKKRVLTEIGKGKNTRYKPDMKIKIREGQKFADVPDRKKAGGEFTYFGHKEEWQKQVITDQVIDISRNMFNNSPIELDDDCHWVVFNGFILPEAWQKANPGKKSVRMMIIFPDQYPTLPTNGFYLPASLKVPQNAAHFYNFGAGGAFGQYSDEMQAMADANWKWYCTHIPPDGWSPAKIRNISDWRHGDNLWEIINTCKEVLSYPLED